MSTLTVHPNIPSFLRAAQSFLESNELDNNMILGLCAGRTQLPPDWTLLSVERDGAVEAVAVKAGARLLLSPTENGEAARLFAGYFREHGVRPEFVFAPSAMVERFAERYGAETDGPGRVCLVHELHQVEAVPETAGTFEPATPEHADVLTDWIVAFEQEAGLLGRKTREVVRAETLHRIARGEFFVWTRDGAVVSMAAIMRATPNIGIVGLVYTPPEHRGAGYATAIVAELSREIQRRGYTRCGLFTDATNPTSNRIYYRIGYRPGTEFMELGFP
jgi:predicted GNAT family acetyltransferase